MGKFFDELQPAHVEFIAAQRVFFVATAPRDGRVNVSPKGMDTFRVLGPRRVAYLDATGSGNETAAHVSDNGRITIMLCGFGEKPLILRLYGRGRAVRPRDAEWAELRPRFPELAGARQIIAVDVESVQTSCGYAVPRLEYKNERETLIRWAEKLGPEGLRAYWQSDNQRSIDGLPTGLVEENPTS